MCVDLPAEMRSGIGRRRLMAGLGLGAAGLALGAGAPGEASAATKPRRNFGPPAARGSKTKLVLLGTAGGPTHFPGNDSAGIASALVVGDRYYLIDAGHGVLTQLRKANLGPENKAPQDGPLDVLAGIFLTHLHSDHVVDLNNVLVNGIYNGLQSVNKIPVWGPGNRGALPPLFGSGPAPSPVSPGNPTPGTREMGELMVQMFATDLNDRIFDNRKPVPSQLWEAKDVPVPQRYVADPNGDPAPEMKPFTFYEDERVKVSATLVNHAPVFPALAYRFDTDDGSVVFSGDTAKCPNLVRLAKNADVLVHEVIDEDWAGQLFPLPRSEAQEGLYQHLIQAHTLKSEVGTIAAQANVKTLVLSHLVPVIQPESVWAACAEGFKGRLVVGRDLDVIDIGK
ncbi:MBL fold metallo-hydrolase [Pseudarthrobacter sp. IC2-21]|uniref:MBL fold metallo-hydrolase n=1 Tax=Pseudarthrobacter sp. IC2-21 TaxID=3092262 RepID=UPI002A6A5899|nr:MBL fold metallo-hydrolase [Pseudarthrobacter sp. IC2-21]